MGNCRYCNKFTMIHCKACLVYACTPHITMHYFDNDHKRAAAQKGIQLDENGKPVTD